MCNLIVNVLMSSFLLEYFLKFTRVTTNFYEFPKFPSFIYETLPGNSGGNSYGNTDKKEPFHHRGNNTLKSAIIMVAEVASA